MSFNIGNILGKEVALERDDYYKVLGCSENATTEQIITEYRIRALKCHPDKNAGNPEALKEFQKLQGARDVLTDPASRNDYDKWRHCEICIPFKKWLDMRNRYGTTMHWAKPKEQTMLENSSLTVQHENDYLEDPVMSSHSKDKKDDMKRCPKIDWESDDTSNVYKSFRNYKI